MTTTKFTLTPMLLALSLLTTACDRAEVTYMVGTLERDRIEIKVESSEPIIAIYARDGEVLKAGSPILDQDPSRAEARLAQLQALRDQARARLAELVRGPRQEIIREARARLEASRVQRVNAAATLERTRGVFEKGLSTQQQLDRDETLYQTAMAQETADTEALDLLLAGTTIEELDQATAALAASEAQVRQVELDLARTKLVAPVDGIVDKVLYQLGERPSPGTTIAVLLNNARIFARVYVPEHLRARVVPGEILDVSIDGIAEPFEGRVRWVSSDASFTPYFALTQHDRSRLSYLAEIDVTGADELPSGVPLQVDFPVR
jgi:HlyD family secretion protein